MTTAANLSIWSDLACAGGVRYRGVPPSNFTYTRSKDNSGTAVVEVDRGDTSLIPLLALRNVLRVNTEISDVHEYYISNLSDDTSKPVATVTGKPVELLMARAFLLGKRAGRTTTFVGDTLSAHDWLSNYGIPSLAAYNQPWWTIGTVDVPGLFTFSLVDQSVLYLCQQLVRKSQSVVRARRNGEVGYYLDLVNISVALTPLAVVGKNVKVLSKELDDTVQGTVAAPSGRVFSGNQEPERITHVGWDVASIAGSVLTLADLSGVSPTILSEDGQPFVSGHAWRLGCIPALVYWNGATNYTTNYGLYRAAYIQSTKKLWGAFGAGAGAGIMSLDMVARTQGSLLTTSLTTPRDLCYYPSTDTLYVVDLGGNRVTPYVTAGPTAGTPITVGTGPRRALHVVDTGFDQILIGHTGSNAILQIDPSTNTVSATSPTMTRSAHMDYVSKTQVYVACDNGGFLYRYNASANTLTTTVSSIGSGAGFASAVYVPSTQEFWACEYTLSGATHIVILDTTTDTIKAVLPTTGVHGTVVDCCTVGGYFYGVTTDGLLVCYNASTHGFVWARRHAAWPSTVILRSLTYLSDVDCFAVTSDSCAMVFMDAQTNGATVARAMTAAAAATPSVTLQNGAFPALVHDEVIFTRSDGYPLFELPNVTALGLYDPIPRPAVNPQLSGGSNRVLNGDTVFYDASRQAARHLNAIIAESATEIKWDGYGADLVQNFTGQLNSSVPTNVGSNVGQNVNLKSVGASRIFLVGDLVYVNTHAITMMVLKKATADGSGNVTLWVGSSYNASCTGTETLTVYRPDPATLLAQASTWVALSTISNTGGTQPGAGEVYADVNLPFIPGDMGNLYFGISALAWGDSYQPNTWDLRILGADRRAVLLDIFPSPDTATYTKTALPQSINLTGSFGLPANFAGGHVQFNLRPLGMSFFNTLYISRMWVQVGNVDRGPPDAGAHLLWQYGQDTVQATGNPATNYQISPLEYDPSNPFVMGAAVRLTDKDHGVFSATPIIVAVTRPLPVNPGEVVQPVLSLNSQNPELTRLLAEALQ